MWILLACLLISALGMLGFIAADATFAFDGDPSTWTLSGRIKQWRRGHPGRALLLTLAAAQLVLVPIFLFLHLVLEVF